MGLHRCSSPSCPVFGQQTNARSCACHRTDEQVLTEQRDELLDALRPFERLARAVEARDARDGLGGLAAQSHVHRLTTDDYRRAIAAVAKATAEQVQP